MTGGEDHLREIAAGEYVFHEGDLGTEMYVIREGRIEILQRQADGDGDGTRLAVLEQGDFFGEVSLLDDEPRSASARALEDCVLIRVNGATFIQMLQENPEIAVRMMRKLTRRLRHTDRLLQEALGRRSAGDPAESSSRPASDPENVTPYRLFDAESGMSFAVGSGEETLIGRADAVTGIAPTIDLTPVDQQRSSSRRHARILRRDGRLLLAEEVGSMNGTFVNDRRLESGEPVEIRPGDHLRFGVLELELRAD